MPYLRVRYRHEVKCREPECSELIVQEGSTSDAVYADGALVRIEAADLDRDLRSAFILHCPAGHEVDLYAPRDLQIMKSAAVGDADFAPIVLRTPLS